MTRGTDCHSRLHGFAMTKRYVILNAERERIRNSPLKEKRIAAHLAAVSPAGSVGASASQRCPPDTRTAMARKINFRSTACPRQRLEAYFMITV